MRLLIDFQAIQKRIAGDARRGQLVDVLREIIKSRQHHSIVVLVDRRDAQSASTIANSFCDIVAAKDFRFWRSPNPPASFSVGGALGHLGTLMRAVVIKSESPDAVLIPSVRDEDLKDDFDWPEGFEKPPDFVLSGQVRNNIGSPRPRGLETAIQMVVAEEVRSAGALASRVWRALLDISTPTQQFLQTATRPTLAFVSPMPPQHTGIADYAAALLPSLTHHYRVTVVSEAKPGPINGAGEIAWLSPKRFIDNAWRFDRVLYQIGNSPFHQYQIEHLLPRCPGIVVLHDVSLSDYRWAYAYAIARPERRMEDLAAAHGFAAVVKAWERGLHNLLPELPLSAPVITAAAGLIVHSRHARDLIARHYGPSMGSVTRVIPHLCAYQDLPDRGEARARLGIAEDAFLVCSFGEVGKKKLPLAVLEAWLAAFAENGNGARLSFVGKAHDGLDADIERWADSLSCADRVCVTGRVEEAEFRDWLAAADTAVQLRTESNGETSGAAIACLGARLPLVVNRHGSFAEFPEDAVRFVDETPTAGELARVLSELANARELRRALSRSASGYVDNMLAPDRIAESYRDAIEHAYSGGLSAGPIAIVRAAASLRPPLPLRDRPELARAIAETWPAARQACLMIEAPTRNIPEAWSGVLGVLLRTPPGNLRAEPVRFVEGALTTAYDWGGALLGIDYRHPEKVVVIQNNDVMVRWERANRPATETLPLRNARTIRAAMWLLLRPDSTDPGAELLESSDGILCCTTSQAGAAARVAARNGLSMPIIACDQREWLARFETAIRARSLDDEGSSASVAAAG